MAKMAAFLDTLFPLENWIFGENQKDNILIGKVLLKSQRRGRSPLETGWKKSGLSKINKNRVFTDR